MAIERIQPGPRMTQAVVHGNTVYLAGQVAANPVPSVAKQTKQILGQIDKLLKAAGTSKAKLLWQHRFADFLVRCHRRAPIKSSSRNN